MMEKIEKAFDALEWHDAVLQHLEIDRRIPGKRDEVVLFVEWPDGRKQCVRFTECYALDAQMNFGVVASESILGARCIADSPKLSEVKHQWRAVGVDLADLRCFEVETNSTASLIRVFARGFEVSGEETNAVHP